VQSVGSLDDVTAVSQRPSTAPSSLVGSVANGQLPSDVPLHEVELGHRTRIINSLGEEVWVPLHAKISLFIPLNDYRPTSTLNISKM
jgi:hypothetical protein